MYFSHTANVPVPCKSRARTTMLATTALIAALSVVPVATFAQTWDGDTSNDWTEDTNWDSDTAPTAADAVIISGGGGATQPVLSTATTVTSTTISGSVLGSGKLTIAAGGDLTNTVGLSQTGGTFTMTGASTLNGPASFSGGTATLGASSVVNSAVTISGGGSVTGSGLVNGTLSLTGGSFTLTGGTVAGTTTNSGGTVTNTNGTFADVNNTAGTFTNTGATGDITITGGTVNLNGTSNVGDTASVAVNGGTLNVNTAETIGALSGTSGAIVLANKLTFGTGTDTSVNSTISGANGLEKQGAGNTTLSGTNTYAGTTTVSAGTLTVANSAGLGTVAGGTVVASGATLALTGGISVGAEALTLNGGTLSNASGNNSYAGNVTMTAASEINSATAGDKLTLSGTVANGGQLLTASGAGDLAFTGVISGAGGLTKTGAGTTTLTGNNTYTGATAVNDGTLAVTGAGKLASTGLSTSGTGTLQTDGGALVIGATITNGGSVDLNGSESIAAINGAGGVSIDGGTLTLNAGTSAISGVVSGAGDLTVAGTSNTTLSGANNYTGTTTVSAGTLTVANSAGLGTVAGGTVVASGATLAMTGGIAVGAEDLTLNGKLSNTSGNNSYAGNVTMAGASEINSAEAGSTLTLSGTMANGGLMTASGAGDLAFTGVISGVGGLTKTGAGNLTLSGTNTFTGAATVNGGKLTLSGGSALDNSVAVTLGAAGNLTLDNSETIGSLGGAAGSTVTLGANTLTTGGNNGSTNMAGVVSGSGGLIKTGTGNFTLSGANDYTGTTTVSAGTLTVANPTGLGTVAGGTAVASGATLALTGGIAVGAEALTLNGGTLSNTSGNNSFGGAVTMTAASEFASAAGTLTLGGTVANGGQLLTASGAGNLTFNGVISGAGGLTKTGNGTTTLAAANTYGGDTTVNGGTLDITGSVASLVVNAFNTAIVKVDGGSLDDTAAVTLNDNSTLQLTGAEEIGSLTGGSNSAVNLGGNTLTTGGNNGTTTMAGVVSGGGGLVKVGTGNFTLSGANVYTGTTTVDAGTLTVTGKIDSAVVTVNGSSTLSVAGLALLDTAAVSLNGTSKLELTGSETIGNLTGATGSFVDLGGNDLKLTTGTSAIGSVISGAGGLTIDGSAATLTAINLYAGNTNVTSGNLTIATLASVVGDVNTSGSGATQNDGSIGGTETTSGGGSFTNNGSVNAVVHNGGTTINSGDIETTLEVNADGATNTATGIVKGNVTVNSGGKLVNDGALGDDPLTDTVTIAANGELDTTKTVDAAVTNDGIVNAEGNINGSVTNQGIGEFVLSGDLLGQGRNFDNNDSARLDVIAGSYTGLGAFTNASGLGVGVNVGNAQSLAATSITNNAGSTIALDGGTLVGPVTNNGTINVNGASAITGSLANAGTLNLQDGVTGDTLAVSGLVSPGGTIALDLNLGDGSADTVTTGGIATANLQFNQFNSGYYGTDIDVLTGKTGGMAGLTYSGLTPTGGAITYSVDVTGGVVQIKSSVNTAVSGVAAGAAITQSLISSVVNRPTSPFISGLAAEESCSHGGYARVYSGIATVGSKIKSNTVVTDASLDTTFSGIQAGYDVGCYDGRFFNGWDGTAGVMLGYNTGSTTQGIFSDFSQPTLQTGVSGSKFNQSSIGLYAAAGKDRLSGDVQLRFDRTDFDLSEVTLVGVPIGLDGKSYSTKSTTFGTRLNYRMDVSEEKAINFVPSIGFNYVKTTGDTLVLDGGQTLDIMAFDTVVGFVGGTLTKTAISPEGTAATTYFVSGNYYQDFGGDRNAQVTDPDPINGFVAPLKIGSVGGFAEASIGVNYLKLLENGPGGGKQINAALRADARFGENVSDSYSLTAQFRLSF